jgi:nanoRNase/pAp phosphatase (c-di-AMP/oligoRNAs hydrolase)
MGVELEVLDEGADVTEHVRGAVALIDTQPGFGNSPLDKDFPVTICIDHHGNSGDNGHVRFRDVRPWIGASSTILTQYYQAAQVEPSTAIATALFYGIKTDTKSLSRDTSAADIGAYFYLLKYVDVDAVVEIETAEVPADYFRSLNRAIQAARVIDGVVTCFLGAVAYPDLTAEVADMFLRLEGVNWVICSSEFEDDLYVSVRARDADADADGLAQEIVGQEGTAGGRNTLAGGQIPLNGSDQDAEEAAALVHRRALAALGIAPDMPGESLI